MAKSKLDATNIHRRWERLTVSYVLDVRRANEPPRMMLIMVTKTIVNLPKRHGYDWSVMLGDIHREGTAASEQEALEAAVRKARLVEPRARRIPAPELQP